MALREVRVMGDPILEKPCKTVKLMTPRLQVLIDDMLDTMYAANGVGLAAPQVGVLRRIVVIDTGEGELILDENGELALDEDGKPISSVMNSKVDFPLILINPEIVSQDGEQTGAEGCLSLPGKVGTVTRPNHVIVRALDQNMKEIEVEGEELLARAICHELDHLDGHMYVEKVEGPIRDVEEDGGEDDDE